MAKKKSAPADQPIGLKIVRAGGKTHGGFVWPLAVGATVTAPDWRPDDQCGGGLHFWPDGEGDVSTCSYHAEEGAIGLVIAPDAKDTRDLGGKSKTRE